MTPADQPSPSRTDAHSPASFLAAAAALDAIDHVLRDAQQAAADVPDAPGPGPEQALASLMLLGQVRERLAGWETGLIETARDAGASWADLAHPLGVASRQAAERRYLRGRPGPAGTTGEERVTATRQARAAERSTATWARSNAADLRRLAGQITALTDLPRRPPPARRAPRGPRPRRPRRPHRPVGRHPPPPGRRPPRARRPARHPVTPVTPPCAPR